MAAAGSSVDFEVGSSFAPLDLRTPPPQRRLEDMLLLLWGQRVKPLRSPNAVRTRGRCETGRNVHMPLP